MGKLGLSWCLLSLAFLFHFLKVFFLGEWRELGMIQYGGWGKGVGFIFKISWTGIMGLGSGVWDILVV